MNKEAVCTSGSWTAIMQRFALAVAVVAALSVAMAFVAPAQQAHAAKPKAGTYELMYKSNTPRPSYVGPTTLLSVYDVKIYKYKAGKVTVKISYSSANSAVTLATKKFTAKVSNGAISKTVAFGSGYGEFTGRVKVNMKFGSGYIKLKMKTTYQPAYERFGLNTYSSTGGYKYIKIKRGSHSTYV